MSTTQDDIAEADRLSALALRDSICVRREQRRRGRLRILRMLEATLALLLTIDGFWPYYRITVSMTDSLPAHFYLLHIGQVPKRGDIAAYFAPANRFYPETRAGYMKIARGVAGDIVRCENHHFSINGEIVGVAKPMALNGLPLWPGPTGVLPPDEYFFWTPHPDSFDSRYSDVGWIRRSQVIGVARPIF